MPPSVQRWLTLALLASLALGVRVWQLDQRPMHADEANQAVKTGQLLEGHGYAFDPTDHHGPTLYYAALPLAWLRGEHTLAQLTETTVRLVPAIAGTVAVVLLYFLALPLGPWPALIAAACLAISPPAVYYSRYFVQETLLLTFTLGAALCALHWWRSGKLGWAIGAGVSVGLMQATKASAPLFLVAAAVGVALARPPRPVATRLGRDLAVALVATLGVAALFYTSFGTHPRGLADALGTYFAVGQRLGADTGHEKPWWYYLQLFAYQRNDGVFTYQLLFSATALCGAVVAFTRSDAPLLRGAAGYAAVLLVVLSAIAYKTPWHAIHFVPPLALLAAGVIASLSSVRPARTTAIGLPLIILLVQAEQVRLICFQRPADERNPYAYVHTSPDALKLRPLVDEALARFPGQPIRIISEESWPLPWYLRGLPDIGYWSQVPADCDGALVIASAGLAEQVQARLKDKYNLSFVGLRPGFTLLVYKRRP